MDSQPLIELQTASVCEEMRKRLLTGNSVCVLGAGTMGSGIAAHLANLGFQVTLLDLSQESVRAGLDRAKNNRPPHFFTKQTAENLRLGSIEENLNWVSSADWVCEAIIEKLDAKRSLYERLEPHLSPSALISTNTSGLELRLLTEGRSASFKRRFVGTHFFNPPRYLKLLELIATEDTDPEILPIVSDFLEMRVARRVVQALDTPGFIANRYGMWSMYQATHVAERLQLSVADVDQITGTFLGRPKSGSFRLNDMVGLDIMEDIASNQLRRCPDDPFIETLSTPNSLKFLYEKGFIGDKAGRGYYERVGSEFMMLDLTTHAYRERVESHFSTIENNKKLALADRLKIALHAKDEVGEFLRRYLEPALRYANYLRNKISTSTQNFDRVMQWGFGWQAGPFEMMDMLGIPPASRNTPFYQPGLQLSLDSSEYVALPDEPQFRALSEYPVLETHGLVRIRDLGDGIQSLELTTKMGSVPPQGVTDLHSVLDLYPHQRFVLANAGRAFSVGFDLKFFHDALEKSDWEAVEQSLISLQSLGEKLESRKVVAAIHGYSLGGGFEIAMSCPIVVAACDAQIGLPESRVGLIPGGRGATLMRLRNQDAAPATTSALIQIAEGKICANAVEAKMYGYLRETDIICFHPDLLIHTAKQLAFTVNPVPRESWKPVSAQILARYDAELPNKLKDGSIAGYDLVVGDQLRHLFVREQSYEACIQAERERFLLLCHRSETKARIAHMLETGKPLRN